MGVRLVRAGAVMGLLTLADDGHIELWSLASGSLPIDSWTESDSVERPLISIPGPHGQSGRYAFLGKFNADGSPTRVVELDTGDVVATWKSPTRPLIPGAKGLPIAMRLAADSSLVELRDDGAVVHHDLRTGQASDTALPITAPLLPEEVDLGERRLAAMDGSTLLVVDLADRHIAMREDLGGRSCATFPALSLPKEASFVDVTDDGTTVTAVRCPPAGAATLYVRAVDGGTPPASYELRYANPNFVSSADNARIVAVASFTGQVAILQDGRWIEPEALQAERSAHNSYQGGWASVDPAGRYVVTRRDAADLELWAITGNLVSRVTRLFDDDAPEPPAFATFAPGSRELTVAWSTATHYDTGTNSAVTATWSFDRAHLVELACTQLPTIPGGAAAQGVAELSACSSPAALTR